MKDDQAAEPESEVVELKPIAGVAPGVYMSAIYALVLLAAVFFLLLFPGIVNGGVRYTIASIPRDAVIWVDGVPSGHTPNEVFIAAGQRELVISRPGFKSEEIELDVKGRLFASLLFAKRERLVVELAVLSEGELQRSATTEFANWAFVGEADSRYQFPPVARAYARDAGGLSDAFVDDAIGQVSSEAQLQDLLAAVLSTRGAATGPLQIAAAVQRAAGTTASAPLTPLQIEAVLQADREAIIADSAWSAASREAAGASIERFAAARSTSAATSAVSVAGSSYVRIPAGSYAVGAGSRAAGGGDIPAVVRLDEYLIAQAEVTVAEYRRFVDANPRWAPDNREQLASQGLADERYLEDWESAEPGMPIRFVSYPAAAAYAGWISAQLAGSGYFAALPSEDEWEVAARLNGFEVSGAVMQTEGRSGPLPAGGAGRGDIGLIGMIGNVWEWCDDWFAPFARIHGRAPSAAAHRVVRGGGWANDKDRFVLEDRGSQEPGWCTPFLGFRIVLRPTAP